MKEVIFTEQQGKQILKMVSDYLQDYGNSECIAQGDEAQIRAIEIMCEIADIIDPIETNKK
ncbi:MAG: hypothetical protein RLZZ86_197 [Cyanobacteriota bacterium]|jgi:phosphotransacetylase